MEALTDPTHLHLLLNHFPTIGFMIGLALFVVSIIANSDDLKRASLVIFAGIALIAIPTYVTGNAAQSRIADLPEVSQTLIETHEGLAFLALVLIELTGAVSWVALWKHRRTRRVQPATAGLILLLALVTMGVSARTANIGGEIRHSEIQSAVQPTSPVGALGRTVGNYVRDTPWSWIACETLHFIGLSLLLGVIGMVDLRMVGMMKGVSFAALDRLLPWGMLGLGLNVATGMLFFAAAPGQYTANPAFYWKLVFLLIAGANTLYFSFDATWTLRPDDEAPGLSKAVASAALFFWAGVMFWGAMLPFIGNAF